MFLELHINVIVTMDFIIRAEIFVRRSRLRKFKSKYRGFWLIVKISMIWYLLLFSGFYFTSNTSALFSDQLGANGRIEADFWPAHYELVFPEKGNSNFDVCEPYEITRIIKNNGPEDMNQTAIYEVFYDKANPKQHGVKVGEGTIEILKKNETAELKFLADKPGRYAFVAKYQSEDKEEAWSKEIKIDCGSGQELNKKNQKIEDNAKYENEQNKNVNNNNNQPVQVEKTEKIDTEDSGDSNDIVEQKDQQTEVKEEKTEENAKPEQIIEKSVEQKQEEEQKPIKEQIKTETKPEVESNPEQENKEGEE